MDIRKGKMAFIVSCMMILVGVIFFTVGHGALWLFQPSGDEELIVRDLFVVRSLGIMALGAFWLLLSLAGSFFHFETAKLRFAFMVAGVLVLVADLVYLFLAATLGAPMLQSPWADVFFAGVILGAFLLSFGGFFLYAARVRGEDTNFVVGNRVGRALNQSKE